MIPCFGLARRPPQPLASCERGTIYVCLQAGDTTRGRCVWYVEKHNCVGVWASTFKVKRDKKTPICEDV